MTRSYLDILAGTWMQRWTGAPMDIVSGFAKGQSDPREFFRQFGGHDAIWQPSRAGRYHVSVLDDHDMIDRNPKRRFSAENVIAARYQQLAHAVGIQLATLGIPCIYYGTEQAFDGGRDITTWRWRGWEAMARFLPRPLRARVDVGAKFGAFGTEGCHFFDPQHPTYLRIAAIARVVARTDKIGLALRRGRQYARDAKFGAGGYLPPQQGELVAWSRIMFDQEVLVAVNTYGLGGRGADVTVDSRLHAQGSKFNVLYRGDWTDAELAAGAGPAQTLAVRQDEGRSVVRIDLPAAGMIILG